MLSQMAKIDIVSLIIVRFSIRNHRWKAENLSFSLNPSALTLSERPAPLLGRLRYRCCKAQLHMQLHKCARIPYRKLVLNNKGSSMINIFPYEQNSFFLGGGIFAFWS